ncbi:daptide-type RiPP biosynthesis methyltransferase [Microbacterium sp. NPDC091662]|uniref:daptide-type RiPP biosynthesis methyltransferase n=1 Tax=Microbacterium sp. NPDC091662 TaxID=3364211 RepID=UPI003814DEC1
MSGLITEAISARLEVAGAVPRQQDLYSGEGADFYERLVGSDRAEVREMLTLARKADGPILDIAAGGGRLTVPLVRSGREVTAIDLSDDMFSHLRRSLPEDSTVECVVADMRDFSLGRRYGLVLIGATSITLLDSDGRSRLYAAVRRHLAAGGVFAFTVAGGASAQSLAIPRDQEIGVPGPEGEEPYLFAQQMEEDGSARVVNWVRVADITAGAEVTVLTSRLHVLDHQILARELVDTGFAVPAVSPVRTDSGVEILLLTTSWAGSPAAGDDDASE